jgi:hypothetical protein
VLADQLIYVVKSCKDFNKVLLLEWDFNLFLEIRLIRKTTIVTIINITISKISIQFMYFDELVYLEVFDQRIIPYNIKARGGGGAILKSIL